MPLTPAQTFDRIERAHAAWTRGGATIAVSSTTSGTPTRGDFRLDLDGKGGVSLRIKLPPKGHLAGTDQAFVLRGARLDGIDYVAREHLVRLAPDRGPINLRLLAVVGGYDDAVGFLLSKDVRERYLEPIRSLGGWRVVPHGLLRQTTAGRRSFTRLDLDAAGKLTAMHVVLPGSRLDWSFTYGPARPTPIPSGLRTVEAFTVRNLPPHYADQAARSAAEAMLRAEARTQSAIVRLDDRATLWFGGSRVRYEGPGRAFAFDGSRLAVATADANYAGHSSRAAVIDSVAALLGDVDPIVRSVLVRTPPFAELFVPEATVRRIGAMSTEGKLCEVLEVKSARFRATIFADRASHLPLSVESSALGPGGRELSTVRRTLRWTAVGQPLPRSLFELRLRGAVRPLPPTRRVATAP